MRTSLAALSVGACLIVIATSLEAQDQIAYPAVVGPLSGALVQNAPFSATAVLTLRGHSKNIPADQDPLRIWDTYTTRLQRDSAGRVRADYEVPDTSSGAPKDARRTVYQVMTEPAAGVVYLVDPKHQVIRSVGPSHAFDADVALEIPLAAEDPIESSFRFLHMVRSVRNDGEIESLGRRYVEGLSAVGRRVTNARHQSVDEQWASPELRMVVSSHHRLPLRRLELEYRLKNIRRAEPPAAVFELPAGYAQHDRQSAGPRGLALYRLRDRR